MSLYIEVQISPLMDRWVLRTEVTESVWWSLVNSVFSPSKKHRSAVCLSWLGVTKIWYYNVSVQNAFKKLLSKFNTVVLTIMSLHLKLLIHLMLFSMEVVYDGKHLSEGLVLWTVT